MAHNATPYNCQHECLKILWNFSVVCLNSPYYKLTASRFCLMTESFPSECEQGPFLFSSLLIDAINFLGFTHICARNQQGTYTVLRNTITKRTRTKLQELKREMMRRRHEPVMQVGKWLRAVVQGYFSYHAVPGNIFTLGAFRTEVIRQWYRALKRRSQRSKLTWQTFGRIVKNWIPRARILHLYPEERFYAKHPR